MLKARPADAEYWQIECAGQTIGDEGTELDLSGANLANGNFKSATFIGAGAMRFAGTNLANADLSETTFTVDGGFGDALHDFYGMNFSNADLRDRWPLTVVANTIDFAGDILDTIIAPPSLNRSAPPCTVEMLKKRPAGDKSWPIACGHTTLGQYFKNLTL